MYVQHIVTFIFMLIYNSVGQNIRSIQHLQFYINSFTNNITNNYNNNKNKNKAKKITIWTDKIFIKCLIPLKRTETNILKWTTSNFCIFCFFSLTHEPDDVRKLCLFWNHDAFNFRIFLHSYNQHFLCIIEKLTLRFQPLIIWIVVFHITVSSCLCFKLKINCLQCFKKLIIEYTCKEGYILLSRRFQNEQIPSLISNVSPLVLRFPTVLLSNQYNCLQKLLIDFLPRKIAILQTIHR